MNTFDLLREIRCFERELLGGVRAARDFELVRAIGWLQEAGERVTAKRLMALAIAPQATLRRSLKRLIDKGVVLRIRAQDDQRSYHLNLRPDIAEAYRAKVLDTLRGGEAPMHRHAPAGMGAGYAAAGPDFHPRPGA